MTFLVAWHLCLSAVASGLPGACAVAPWAAEAAALERVDAPLLLAVAGRENRWRPHDGPEYCGAWQVAPRWSGLTCAELQGQPGAMAAARLLRSFGVRRNERRALERYAGCTRGCTWYTRDVQALARRLR